MGVVRSRGSGMAKRALTSNEKQVLFGLVRHPTRNDRELSEVLGIKVSTVTAIRRRLRRAEYFATRRIPMMHRLGWEILAAGHGQIARSAGSHAAARLKESLEDRFPPIFHFAYSPDHFFLLANAPSYTAFRRDLEDLRGAMHKTGLLEGGLIDTVVLPVGLTAIANFFDYSHVLALAFGIDDGTSVSLQHPKVGDIELSRKETDVLRGLVRHPELSDKAVAQKIKASRQAVSKMRREFEAAGLLRTARIPNVRALGFELYLYAFPRFMSPATIRARTDAIEHTLSLTPHIFYATSNAESVILGTVRSYEHFSSLRGSIVKLYDEEGFLAREPAIQLGLVSMTEILRNCEFGPLVQMLREPSAG